jgi:hypothetical protein
MDRRDAPDRRRAAGRGVGDAAVVMAVWPLRGGADRGGAGSRSPCRGHREKAHLVLLMLTFVVPALTLGLGRTHAMQGAVHLVIFAAFVFLALVP